MNVPSTTYSNKYLMFHNVTCIIRREGCTTTLHGEGGVILNLYKRAMVLEGSFYFCVKVRLTYTGGLLYENYCSVVPDWLELVLVSILLVQLGNISTIVFTGVSMVVTSNKQILRSSVK